MGKAFDGLGSRLLKNSYFLMANILATSLAALGFWWLGARLLSPQAVGLGSVSLVSANLIATLTSLGLGFGLVRFLPAERDRSGLISFCLVIILAGGFGGAVVFLAGMDLWAPSLGPLSGNLFFLVSFVILAGGWSLSMFMDQVFLASLKTSFSLRMHLFKDMVALALLIALAVLLGDLAIISAYALGILGGNLLSLFRLLPRAQPGFRFRPRMEFGKNRRLWSYSLSNYLSELLQNSAYLIPPIMVANVLGPARAAFFYIPWNMGIILIRMSASVSLSLFAEGAHEEERLWPLFRRALFSSLVLAGLIVLGTFLLAGPVLSLFGPDYAHQGETILKVMALAAIPGACTYILLGFLRILGRLRVILLTMGLIAVGTILLGGFLIGRLGLMGAGMGWLAAQTIAALFLMVWFGLKRRELLPDRG